MPTERVTSAGIREVFPPVSRRAWQSASQIHRPQSASVRGTAAKGSTELAGNSITIGLEGHSLPIATSNAFIEQPPTSEPTPSNTRKKSVSFIVDEQPQTPNHDPFSIFGGDSSASSYAPSFNFKIDPDLQFQMQEARTFMRALEREGNIKFMALATEDENRRSTTTTPPLLQTQPTSKPSRRNVRGLAAEAAKAKERAALQTVEAPPPAPPPRSPTPPPTPPPIEPEPELEPESVSEPAPEPVPPEPEVDMHEVAAPMEVVPEAELLVDVEMVGREAPVEGDTMKA